MRYLFGNLILDHETNKIDTVDHNHSVQEIVSSLTHLRWYTTSTLFDQTNLAFNLSHVLPCGRSVNLNLVHIIFNAFKLPIHQDKADKNPLCAYSLTTLVKVLLSTMAFQEGRYLLVRNLMSLGKLTKKDIPLTKITSTAKAANLCSL